MASVRHDRGAWRVLWADHLGPRPRARSRSFHAHEDAVAFLVFAQALEDLARARRRAARAERALAAATTALSKETDQP